MRSQDSIRFVVIVVKSFVMNSCISWYCGPVSEVLRCVCFLPLYFHWHIRLWSPSIENLLNTLADLYPLMLRTQILRMQSAIISSFCTVTSFMRLTWKYGSSLALNWATSLLLIVNSSVIMLLWKVMALSVEDHCYGPLKSISCDGD